MNHLKFPALLLIIAFVFSFVSCDKEDPVNPDNQNTDTIFAFTCKVKDVAWNGSAKAAANPNIGILFPQIDSLPVALFTGDTLMMGVGGLYNGYQATMLMGLRTANKSDLRGTYQFAPKIGSLSAGTAIGLFDGSSNDLAAYAFSLDALEYVDSSRIIITEHKNNRISGTFRFNMKHSLTGQEFNKVTEGSFKNFKIQQ